MRWEVHALLVARLESVPKALYNLEWIMAEREFCFPLIDIMIATINNSFQKSAPVEMEYDPAMHAVHADAPVEILCKVDSEGQLDSSSLIHILFSYPGPT